MFFILSCQLHGNDVLIPFFGSYPIGIVNKSSEFFNISDFCQSSEVENRNVLGDMQAVADDGKRSGFTMRVIQNHKKLLLPLIECGMLYFLAKLLYFPQCSSKRFFHRLRLRFRIFRAFFQQIILRLRFKRAQLVLKRLRPLSKRVE